MCIDLYIISYYIDQILFLQIASTLEQAGILIKDKRGPQLLSSIYILDFYFSFASFEFPFHFPSIIFPFPCPFPTNTSPLTLIFHHLSFPYQFGIVMS